jgi:hypothetical protein
VAANYGINLEVRIKAQKLKIFNDRIKNTQDRVKKANEFLDNLAKSVDGKAVPSISNLSKTLNEANKAFRDAAVGTPQAKRAAEDYAKATKLVNETLREQNLLLEDAQLKLNKRPGLQNKFTTTSSPFAASRDFLGRSNAEINALLDDKADLVMKQQEEAKAVQNALKPTLQGNRLQQQQNATINKQLDERAELYMIQNQEIKDIANTIRTKKIKELEAEAKIQNEILNARAKQVQLDRDETARRRSRQSIERRRDILESPGGRFARFRRGRTRGDRAIRNQALSNALIGGAFPLLFGQGVGAAAGGGLGGGAGGILGGQFGFALSLVGTSVGAALDRLVQGLNDFGSALKTTDGALKLMTERNLFSSKAIEKQAEALKRQGRQAELNELITRDLTNSLGVVAVKDVQKFSTEMEELSRMFGILTTQFQILAAGPLAKVVDLINTVVGRQVLESRISNQLRALEKGDPEAFKQFIKDNPRTAKEFGLGLLSGTLKQQSGLGIVDTDIGPGGFKFGGRSDEQLQGFSTNLDSILKKSGINSNLILGGNDPDEILKVLQAEEGNLRKKQDALNSSFGIESAIAVIKENNSHLDDKTLNDLETKARKQLEINEKLEIENFQLQITLDLYNNIASSIENGIVSAIEGAIQGTKTLGDVARSVFAEIQRSLIRFGVNAFLGGLPGIGKFFRANGGPVSTGKSYMVGERGPEMFVPNAGGRIVSNENLAGGSTNVVVNVDASGSSVEGDEAQGRELGRLISVAVQSEIIQQQRPGGLLA